MRVWTRGGVDRWLTAELRFPGGRTARLTCALLSATFLRISARVVGDAGDLRVLNWVAPQFFHRLRIVTTTGTRVERVKGAASYDEQLRAFVAAVREGTPFPTAPADAIANMRAIDADLSRGRAVRRSEVALAGDAAVERDVVEQRHAGGDLELEDLLAA